MRCIVIVQSQCRRGMQGLQKSPRLCGCPLQRCCKGRICADGAVCHTFSEEGNFQYDEPTDTPVQLCVAAPATGEVCGELEAPCCFNDTQAKLSDGQCAEGNGTRVGYCETIPIFFDSKPGPRCRPGVLKQNDAECERSPDEVSSGAVPCCSDKTCPGDRVCRPFESGFRGPQPSFSREDDLQCYSCEGRSVFGKPRPPCGAATPNNVKCCADLASFGPGFPKRLYHCAASDGSSNGNNTMCMDCGREGEDCCNESVAGSLAAEIALLPNGCAKSEDRFLLGGSVDAKAGAPECRLGKCVQVCDAGTGEACIIAPPPE
jgi:hypothetical protein